MDPVLHGLCWHKPATFSTVETDFLLAKNYTAGQISETRWRLQERSRTSPHPIKLTEKQKWKDSSLYSVGQIQTFCQDLNTFAMSFPNTAQDLKTFLNTKVHINLANLSQKDFPNTIYTADSQQNYKNLITKRKAVTKYIPPIYKHS